MKKPKAKRLLIVESPGKVKKIQSYLGSEFRVMASMGHVRDLPADELGVDVEAGFVPKWATVAGKNNVIKRLVKAMNEAEAIYLATDPDREGEAIAAHILALTKLPREKPVMRVTFSAITQAAVRQAVENPRRLDMALVAAQHARRKLDRLVGYLVSPVACRVLEGRYSAGRVQSPALRLVVERERAIQSFTPETYFVIEASLGVGVGEAHFKAKLIQVQGQELPLKDMAFVKKLAATLNSAVYWVGEVTTETVLHQPPAPFTTSTLQQVASSQLGFSPEKTMQLAQTLYETSLITYMRTDAVFVSPEAQTAAFDFIGKAYGEPYLPTEKPHYKSKPNAQEAHEAIRPADVTLTPEHIKESKGRLGGQAKGLTEGSEAAPAQGAALYGLIWRRFVASQMSPALETVQTISVLAGKAIGQSFPLKLATRGITPQFDGFRRVYQVISEVEEDESRENDNTLPALQAGQSLTLHKLLPQQKQTQAPTRFSEAQLVHELEKRGIGRPSTYAAILSNLKSREYVRLDKKRLIPTETGSKLTDYLLGGFASLFTYDYTARLENTLDEIAAGGRAELEVLQAFWGEFQPLLRGATAEIRPLQPSEPQKTGEQCPQCGSELVYRASSKGQFIGCSTFPKCRYSLGLEQQPLILQPLKP